MQMKRLKHLAVSQSITSHYNYITQNKNFQSLFVFHETDPFTPSFRSHFAENILPGVGSTMCEHTTVLKESSPNQVIKKIKKGALYRTFGHMLPVEMMSIMLLSPQQDKCLSIMKKNLPLVQYVPRHRIHFCTHGHHPVAYELWLAQTHFQ